MSLMSLLLAKVFEEEHLVVERAEIDKERDELRNKGLIGSILN